MEISLIRLFADSFSNGGNEFMGKYRNIIIGLSIFVVLAAIPFWYNVREKKTPPEVSLDTPQIRALEVKQCIEDTEYMRAGHMELLAGWKESVVREGERVYTARDGKEYLMCIEETCLDCHSNKEEFCDACHDYAGVEPNCWSCHNAQQEMEEDTK
ncbi:MAG: sulfate reduction electron transfer complex DsrMKJOP subunit DsrJ [Peptococcaceae bacterium]